MALFTQAQVNVSKLSISQSHTTGGVHDWYVFRVIDGDGLVYQWTDVSLAANATQAQVKTAVSNYLLSIEKKTAEPSCGCGDAAGVGLVIGSM